MTGYELYTIACIVGFAVYIVALIGYAFLLIMRVRKSQTEKDGD